MNSDTAIVHEALLALLQQGEEASIIHRAIVEAACTPEHFRGAALFLPPDRQQRDPSFVVAAGTWEDSCPISVSLFESICPAPQGGIQCHEDLIVADILCLGAPIGMLVVATDNTDDWETYREQLCFLATLSGTVFERQNLSATVQHLLDRLEVLSELNQLVASNVSLPRIINIVCRESCFRFSADMALTYLFREKGQTLGLRGGYGCPQQSVPSKISLDSSFAQRVINEGARSTLIRPGVDISSGETLAFERLGIKVIMACCLEVRSEISGVVLLGYSVPLSFSPQDRTRFEEFAKAASVAVDNARIHDQLKAYTERLEDIVHERTRELEIQTQRAEEANTAKSRFLANMSHELRTPLTAIIGYASILEENVFGPLNEKQYDGVKSIARSGDHLKRLIDDVLNLARVESGKEDVRAEELNVRESVAQIHKMMMQSAIDKNISFAVPHFPDKETEYLLNVDPKHFRQILLNLLSNGIKYTPAGGSLSIHVNPSKGKDSQIQVLNIDVVDTGVGLSPKELESLWDRFTRGEDTYSREQEGTGIGLHLTRSLIEINGGSISVESQENKGSSFRVSFPLHERQAGAVDEVIEDHQEVSFDGFSAVIVDDNDDARTVLRHILNDRGLKVREYNSVATAIEALEASTPNIVMTDLAMSGKSGLDLLAYIRGQQEPVASLPVVVLSACAFEKDRQAVFDAGANYFIAKPFRPSEVIRTVVEILNPSQERECNEKSNDR